MQQNVLGAKARKGRGVLAARWPGVVLIALCVMMLWLSLSVQRGATLLSFSGWQAFSLSQTGSTPTPAPATPRPAPTPSAAHLLVRIAQMNPTQYASTEEYNTWAASACSAASMTEVINAYRAQTGQEPYRITTILAAEIRAGAITSDLGLLNGYEGIKDTVSSFHFTASNLSGDSLDTLIALANGGVPIIVAWPPQTWAGGHLLVLRGGDAQNVQLADSSNYNKRIMTRTQFMQYWREFAVLVQPAK